MKKILILLTALMLGGCMPSSGLVSKPEDIYSQVGFGSYTSVDDSGIATITFAGVGLNDENQIVSMMVDQIDIDTTNPDHSMVSKRLLGNCYGIGFESKKGDWATQMLAFENLMVGKKYSIESLKESQLTINGDVIKAAEGSDLSSACTIELTDQIYAIEDALNNVVSVENGCYFTLGQYTDIHVNIDNHSVALCLLTRDYQNIIQESYIEEYIITNDGIVKSSQDEAVEVQFNFLEKYMIGKRTDDIIDMEVYDKGDGIYNSLPMENSDLATGFFMNLDHFTKALENGLAEVNHVCK